MCLFRQSGLVSAKLPISTLLSFLIKNKVKLVSYNYNRTQQTDWSQLLELSLLLASIPVYYLSLYVQYFQNRFVPVDRRFICSVNMFALEPVRKANYAYWLNYLEQCGFSDRSIIYIRKLKYLQKINVNHNFISLEIILKILVNLKKVKEHGEFIESNTSFQPEIVKKIKENIRLWNEWVQSYWFMAK